MIRLSNQEAWRPWMAFALEAVVLVLMITVCATMQAMWGWTGLVLTELLFLALAVGVALGHKTPLREVFPLHAPSLREAGGGLAFAAAGMMLAMLANGISMVLLPQFFGELSAIVDFLYVGQSLPAMILVIALMPAICEEALHRGAILSHLRALKSEWLVILIMGVFFGLFHVSVLKFLSTAILGGILSYLMIKSNNLVLPMLTHFLYNLCSVVVGSMSGDVGSSLSAVQSMPALQLIGSYCILGSLAPILLVLAARLVNPGGHKGRRWLIGGLCSVALATTGILCMAASM
jgi:membrane protease YdiL (CAAX protease family)